MTRQSIRNHVANLLSQHEYPHNISHRLIVRGTSIFILPHFKLLRGDIPIYTLQPKQFTEGLTPQQWDHLTEQIYTLLKG